VTSAERTDYRVTTRDGVGLRVRSVARPGGRGEVIVLVHGIAAPLEPTYDLPVPGYSFLEELAGRGYRAVAFDHRNFGRSDRAAALGAPPEPDPSGRGVQTLDDSVEDIRAVVEDACSRYDVPRVTLFGSSRGAIQVLAHVATDGAHVSLAILNNPSSLCYLSAIASGPLLAEIARGREEARRAHNYTQCTATFQRQRWRHLFGSEGGGGSQTVDPAIQDAYIACCIESDPDGARQSPPIFRVPTESFPERLPLIPLERLGIPVLIVEAEEAPDAHVAAFLASVPPGRARWVRLHDSNHFTLRNARRFELANLIDAAITARAWGAATR
jgi:pimeloyl-ACP methyl ester carboxylesterase